MPGNSPVRFGERDGETWFRKELKRFIPTLPLLCCFLAASTGPQPEDTAVPAPGQGAFEAEFSGVQAACRGGLDGDSTALCLYRGICVTLARASSCDWIPHPIRKFES